MTMSFPVLDIQEVQRGPAARETFLTRLREAAHDIGFFQLVGHEVRGAERILELSAEFFSLPQAELDALSIVNSPHFRGYSSVGRELTGGKPDQREQLDIGPELPARTPGPDEPSYLWLAGPNQWPASMPHLRPAITEWISQLTTVAQRLIRLILASLDTSEGFLDSVIAPDPHVHFKLLHYPGAARTERGVGQGIGVHKDYGLVTLLLQDHHGGLQVSLNEGEFLDVPVIPGAFVVNLGELIEVATCGYLRATTHRVVTPSAGVDRYAAPFFFNPRLDAVMRSLPRRFVRAAGGVDVQAGGRQLTASYGTNTMQGMLRAFPEIIVRHHPELVG